MKLTLKNRIKVLQGHKEDFVKIRGPMTCEMWTVHRKEKREGIRGEKIREEKKDQTGHGAKQAWLRGKMEE